MLKKKLLFDFSKYILLKPEEFYFPINFLKGEIIKNGENLSENMEEIIFSYVNGHININKNYYKLLAKTLTIYYYALNGNLSKEKFNVIYNKYLEMLNDGENFNLFFLKLNNNVLIDFFKFFESELIFVMQNGIQFYEDFDKRRINNFDSFVVYKRKKYIEEKIIKFYKYYLKNPKIRIDKEEYDKYCFAVTTKEKEPTLCWSKYDYSEPYNILKYISPEKF